MAIWTHVAGQTTAEAPSPLAFVAAVIHGVGAWLPRGRDRRSAALAGPGRGTPRRSRSNTGDRARAIRHHAGRVAGVETAIGRSCRPTRSISNAGVGTYLELLPTPPPPARTPPAPAARSSRPASAPISPSAANAPPPYLRFCLPGEGEALSGCW